jgi:hypothetical protein
MLQKSRRIRCGHSFDYVGAVDPSRKLSRGLSSQSRIREVNPEGTDSLKAHSQHQDDGWKNYG